jgi:hypothetical protein
MINGSYRTAKIEGSSNRMFGYTMVVFFVVIALLPWYFEQPIHHWALFVGAWFLLLALFFPQRLWRLNFLWMHLGLLMGKIVSPLAMAVVFFAVITPFGLVIRLFGKPLMPLGFDTNTASYWQVRQPPGPDPKTMKNLF